MTEETVYCKRCRKGIVDKKEDGSWYANCPECRAKLNAAVKKSAERKKAEQERKKQITLKRMETLRNKKLMEQGHTIEVAPPQPEEVVVAEEAPKKRGKPITDEAPRSEALLREGSQPWKPASLLHVANKDPNFTYKWCRRDLMDKRIAEGWETVQAASGVNAPDFTLADGRRLTSLVVKRNLILCRMPKDLAKSRSQYYQKLADDNMSQGVEQFKRGTKLPGYDATAYGKIEIDAGQKR